MSSICVKQGQKSAILYAEKGHDLLEILRRNGFNVTAPCGGKGRCGKCEVRLIQDGVEKTVLACRTEIEGDCTVIIPESGSGGVIQTEGAEYSPDFSRREGLGAAVDIGTTTVVLRLFDLESGRELGSRSGWNAQGPYGADVLSRTQYIMEHPDGLELLSGLVRKQVFTMLRELCIELELNAGRVREMFIAGNTIMQHIFAGISPASIALAPFTPESLFDDGKPMTIDGVDVYMAPCTAGYVGGDITAGLLASRISERHDRALFLDIGTNGEMALGGRDGFVSCAVACGPAFEGAGISCGMTSTPGAISHVDWADGEFKLTVIGDCTPKGICGSGLIDLMAVLLRLGLVDESGLLLNPDEAPEGFETWLDEDENGNGLLFLTVDDSVYFTAADVRQLQLAKAAVAAGISVLMGEGGLSFDDIEALYIAGGFGSHMRAESAVEMGMLPEALLDKTVGVGNASLSGATEALLSLERRKALFALQKGCGYLELSGNEAFNAAYPAHMSFDKEEIEWN